MAKGSRRSKGAAKKAVTAKSSRTAAKRGKVRRSPVLKDGTGRFPSHNL